MLRHSDGINSAHVNFKLLPLLATLQEVAVPTQARSLQMFNEKLCVGYQSGFSLFHLYVDGHPQSKATDITLALNPTST